MIISSQMDEWLQLLAEGRNEKGLQTLVYSMFSLFYVT